MPMPSQPLTSTVGRMGQYHSGSMRTLSSLRKVSWVSSLGGKRRRARGLSMVKMYLWRRGEGEGGRGEHGRKGGGGRHGVAQGKEKHGET